MTPAIILALVAITLAVFGALVYASCSAGM